MRIGGVKGLIENRSKNRRRALRGVSVQPLPSPGSPTDSPSNLPVQTELGVRPSHFFATR